MRFIIEPLNDTDCRIVDIDCSDEQGRAVEELVIPSTGEQDGKTYQVKQVGPKVCSTNKYDDNTAKFASLRRLKKIVFSEGIEVIDGSMNAMGWNADERGNGESLKEVVLPSTLKVIGNDSFRDCRQLSSINVPESVEVIGRLAFDNCSQLTVFQWPKSLRKIGKGAFAEMNINTDEKGVPTLELEIPDTIEVIENPYSNYRKCFNCSISAKAWPVLDASDMTERIREIDIPEGVTKVIGHYRQLRRVTLPSTLEEIGENAFEESHALDCIQDLPPHLKAIGKKAFCDSRRSDEPKEIRIQSDDMLVGKDAFAHNKNLKIVGDEAAMRNLMRQPGALNGTLIEAIDIPEGVTEMYVRNCPELKRLTIPSSVTTIREISNCPKLEELVIPSSVTTIGEISACPELKELVVPDSVTKIQTLKWLGIKNLRLSENLVQLCEISRCEELKHLTLPASLKKLKDDPSEYGVVFDHLKAEIDAPVDVWKLICNNSTAFREYCPESGELTIPEGVDNLAGSLFVDTKLTTLNLPSTLKKIGARAFEGMKNLKALTIPAGVEVIPQEMAKECSVLESVEFAYGSQLKEIKSEAFAKTALKNVDLPDGISTFGNEVFKDIEALETVTFPASMPDCRFTDKWNHPVPLFVRCKNLKYVVFLADNPAKAVYPVALGKLCDWYVPDNMVDHVKAFIVKAKAENPNVKSVGAKSVKPISKLKGGAPALMKAVTTKKQALTQPIKMEAFGLNLIYRFPVSQRDLDMLNNDLDRAILAARYLGNKASECTFTIEDNRERGNTWTVEELSLNTQVNSATEKQWHCTPKTTVTLDFNDSSSLPEDFPTDKAVELTKHGGFMNLFASRCSNFMKELPENAPAYLEVSMPLRIDFDFMIGEKEKFNVKKITVMKDWDYQGRGDRSCWRFGFMYNGRYVSATGFMISGLDYMNRIVASKTPDMEDKIESKTAEFDGVEFDYFKYISSGSLPFINDMLAISN